MNKEEIRKELIRILKGSNSNGYMWYYDAKHRDGFPVFDSLVALINAIPDSNNKKYPLYTHDHYEKLPKETEQ